ncbi:uncharacterized protein BP5553_00991 [Venustampulla echinocandica]|uniref:C2H2-type domain-containing protein n=1 Tax=Venustampulla echinocandica TaxID=2656787 RepID=A0A370TZQ7_9HELO|nr:uncharacterized protein BP5553_00991 [Venustampulla echinocandica]RDL41012.1 hypothetical protein BP5553_00991 [Venustampulla echinocandica]
MSLLSRRSASQRSYVPGNDEITVRKVQPNDTESESHVGSLSSDASKSTTTTTTDFALYDSCVARKFPNHKASHLRFLAWVAYTRKFTDEPITEDERRTCPLLWCRSVFKDQEAMLQHVWNCEHLSKGLYWCFQCQKPERVGNFQCKRCQGLPSRTDRLATVARRIFSKLGSKNHRIQRSPPAEPEMSLAKVPEASKAQQQQHDRMSAICDAGPVGGWGQQFAMPEQTNAMDHSDTAGDWTTDFQELPDTQICEMNGSAHPIELSADQDRWVDNDYSNSQGSWYNQKSPARDSNPVSGVANRPETILPRLNTQSLPSQGQDFPSEYPSGWSEGPLVDTIVSPLSTVGHFTSPFHEISPTDTEASGRSFFTDSGYTSGTIGSCATSPPESFELNPGFNEPRGKKRSRDYDMAFEEPSLEHTALTVMTMQSMSTSSSIDQKIAESTSSSHSPSRCPSTKKPKMQSPYWSSAISLVQSFSDVLDAHISHTKEILRSLPSTPITTELLAMSRSSMVCIGLEALLGIIEGRNPTAIVQAFAFTHISFAFAIAIDHDEIKVHTQEWFRDSLSWVAGLGSIRQRNRYVHIAKAVWQPVDSLRESCLPGLFSMVDKENRLVLACKRFLDVLESLGASENTSSPTNTTPGFPPSLFAQEAQARVIEPLIKTASIEAFIEDVVKVEERLNRYHITSVRELELELMCAGKLASQSELAYSRFLSHVTALCDSLYESSSQPRTSYHIANISQIKQLLPEETYGEHGDEDREFELELDDDLPLDFNMGMFGQGDRSMPGYMNKFTRDANGALRVDCEFPHDFSTLPPPNPTIAPITQSNSQREERLHAGLNSSSPTSGIYPKYDLKRIGQKPKLSSTFLSSSSSPLPLPTPSAFKSVDIAASSSSSPDNIPPSQPKKQTYQCPQCPYLPEGIEKYKASNLRRHKRTQHPSGNEKGSYLCTWPGCGRTFTRSDNLMSHKKGKGHVLEFDVRNPGGCGGDKDCSAEGEDGEHGLGERQFGSDLKYNQWENDYEGGRIVAKRRRRDSN